MVTRFSESGEPAAANPDASWLRLAMLCDTLAATRSKLIKRKAMAEYLHSLDANSAGLAAQYLTGAVFPESDDRKVQVGGQLIVRALESITDVSPEKFHAVYRKYGDLGSAAEELLLSHSRSPEMMSLADIAARLDALAAARGQAAKSAQFVYLIRAASPIEAKYLIKLLLGDMRIGVKQSLVEEAIAVAVQEGLPAVRRAEMMLGNIPAVVKLAWRHEMETARFQMFHPLGFMLATPAVSAEEAYARFATPNKAAEAPQNNSEFESKPGQQSRFPNDRVPQAHIEDKYDGMRAQVHCGDLAQPGRVRIFSRTREDVTVSFPELAEWFCSVNAPAILDGEILAWDYDRDRALPFTALQQRLGRKRVPAAMRETTRVLYMAFDLLLAGENLLLDLPLRERRAALQSWTERAWLSAGGHAAIASDRPQQENLFATDTVTEDTKSINRLRLAPAVELISAAQIDDAFCAAQLRGNEGLMLKSLESVYEPGRRGSAWLKLKRELATLDVVVTAVEYGHGRRAKVLSDYTFAVRDNATFRNVGKAYSGLTDVEIENLTQWFLEHTLDTQFGQLLVEPKIVLEVAFNNVMQSERHDSGYSLRFPRILRIRTDKPVEEIDTIERVAEIFHAQHTIDEDSNREETNS